MLFRKRTYTDQHLIALLRGVAPERETALHYIFVASGWRAAAYRAIRALGGDLHDAEDAIQEALIVLDEHVRAGRFQGASTLKNYFIGICRGRWQSNRRSLRRIEWTDAPLPAQSADPEEPESLLLQNELKNAIRELLEQMDERCRELLRMYKLSYAMEEISNALALGNANNARQRIHQCRQKLARLMESAPLFNDYRHPK
jgi:RNA polymerase sigma factor (sigma-70 family)